MLDFLHAQNAKTIKFLLAMMQFGRTAKGTATSLHWELSQAASNSDTVPNTISYMNGKAVLGDWFRNAFKRMWQLNIDPDKLFDAFEPK